MKKNSLLIFICTLANYAFAQAPTTDLIETNSGTLTIEPIYHASLVLKWNNKTIYVDPSGGDKAFKKIASPDLVLITDIHQDHLDLETLKSINTTKATFIVPQAVADKLPAHLKSKAIVIKNGESKTQMGINITALPMYNLPEEADSRHPKGRGNGYLLSMGGKIIYISGDTEDIREMRILKNVDIAFVCMNLPYTMSINQAADAVLEFKPHIVYPYHYRGENGLSDVEEFKKMVNDKNAKIEVRLRNWYPGF
jgi:L-ascorbate metabolism protein UlaG (beta-lactamase superfamily)